MRVLPLIWTQINLSFWSMFPNIQMTAIDANAVEQVFNKRINIHLQTWTPKIAHQVLIKAKLKKKKNNLGLLFLITDQMP